MLSVQNYTVVVCNVHVPVQYTTLSIPTLFESTMLQATICYSQSCFYALSYMSYQALECYVHYIIEDLLRGPGIYYIRAHRVAEMCKTRNMQVLGIQEP